MSGLDHKPRPCKVCGRVKPIMGWDRCQRCYMYHYKYGVERPVDLPSARGDGVPGCMTTPDVVAAVGCTFRQLDHWTRKGYVAPSGHVAEGSGKCRWWTAADVAAIRLAVARMEWGMTVPAAFREVDPPLPVAEPAEPSTAPTASRSS